ncbi:MAG: Dyp-type peroxidase [Deltaproteobacteria bacterium]|jgi:putative iron-dependent peroxidase|nr:Dyp-type peroxidase [Deltaproteobacteria bacterium]
MSGVQDVEAKPGANAIFMVWGIDDYPKAKEVVSKITGELEALVRSRLNRFPGSETGAVMGFGAQAWAQLFPNRSVPPELEVFKEIKGEKHVAPSTPGDLFFHIRSSRMDICQELAAVISLDLSEVAHSLDETQGFRFFDSRALIGFVDGTENPESLNATQFARIAGDKLFAKSEEFLFGSYALVQKYLHDMKAWEKLPVEEQEKVIGRHKFDDRELTDDLKPENAHNAVTNISDENGEELKIVRANMPFANPSKGEFGTYFIGYSGKFSTTKRMLENMFIGDPPGNTDRLLEFSTPITGTLFFVPSATLLSQLAEED